MAPFLQELSEILSEPLPSVVGRERKSLERILDASGSRVVLFGAGSIGRRAVACLRSIGVEPLAFADNNTCLQGSAIEGVRVMRPSEAAGAFGRDATFLVTIWNPHHRYREAAAQLREAGCLFVSPVAPLLWRFSEVFLPFFSVDLPHKTIEDRERVLEAAALLSDAQSRSEYLEHIRWRVLGSPECLPFVTDHSSYFDPTLYALCPNEVFVDCGAYDGDSLLAYLRVKESTPGEIHLIEGNPLMWPSLEKTIADLSSQHAPAVKLHKCAVGDRRATLRFDSQGGTGGRITDQGDVAVDCIPLDQLFDSRSVTFVKMDIEGAEYDALRGARHLIAENRPILAICVYHTQNDLWRIPLFIHDLVADYQYYLRTYEADGWQAVLYAIPNERASKLNAN